MTITTSNGEQLALDRLAEGVAWHEGQERAVAELYSAQPITQAQLAALVANGWQDSCGKVFGGQWAVLDCRVRMIQMVKPSAEDNLRTDLQAAQEAAAARAAELEQILSDARAGLIAAPEAGEAWDAAKWYRSGDTVMYQDVGYTCRKTCKGKEPGADSLIAYWEATPKEEPGPVLAWGEIAGGEMIPVGQIVTHNDKTWRCVKAHARSVIRQPSAVQVEYWEAVG